MTYESELSIRLKQIEGLVLTTSYVGLVEEDGYYHYSWNVTITYNNQSYSSPYWCGTGYNKKPSWIIHKDKGFYNKTLGEYKSAKDAIKAGWVKPVPPTLADVMYSLFVDANCAADSHEDYCNEFGYDTDSRKQLEIYLTCQKTRSTLIKMFGQELFDELSRLEH